MDKKNKEILPQFAIEKYLFMKKKVTNKWNLQEKSKWVKNFIWFLYILCITNSLKPVIYKNKFGRPILMVLFKLVRDILAFLPYFLNLNDNFLFGHNRW